MSEDALELDAYHRVLRRHLRIIELRKLETRTEEEDLQLEQLLAEADEEDDEL
jgi:hypothetical protein